MTCSLITWQSSLERWWVDVRGQCCSMTYLMSDSWKNVPALITDASRKGLWCACCRSVSKVNDEWFADEVRVRATVGLVEHVPQRRVSKEVRSRILVLSGMIPWGFLQKLFICMFTCFCFCVWHYRFSELPLTTLVAYMACGQLLCGICFETHAVERMKAPACGHFFCNSCWTGGWCFDGMSKYTNI
jgi:hypothetical protein